MIYVLDFFWVSANGKCEEVGRDVQKAKSLTIVESRAKAILKNVRVKDRRVNFCLIKHPTGRVLSEIGKAPRDFRAEGAASPEAPTASPT